METQCWCPFEGHKYGRRKPTETSVFVLSYKWLNSSLEKLIKNWSIIYSETRNAQIAKSQKIGNVVINPHKSFPGRQIKMPRHAKDWKLKRPLSLNKEPFRTENLIELRCLNVVIPHESRNSEDVESFLVWILVTPCVNREHKYGRGFDLGTNENKSSEWPERDANPGPRVFESHALTTRPRCYVWWPVTQTFLMMDEAYCLCRLLAPLRRRKY